MKKKYRFLILVLSIICIDSKAELIKIDSITQNNNFLLNLSATNKSFPPKKNKSRKGFDAVSIFIGYSSFSGNLSSHFTNAFIWGCNLENYNGKFVFQIDNVLALGFFRSKDSLVFSNQTYWKKNIYASYVIGSLNIGYAIIDNNYITVIPIGGVSFFALYADANKNTEKTFFTVSYKLGFFVDFKKMELPRRSPKSDLYCLRLSFGFHSQIINPKYPEYFNGSIISVTLGLRTKQNKKGH